MNALSTVTIPPMIPYSTGHKITAKRLTDGLTHGTCVRWADGTAKAMTLQKTPAISPINPYTTTPTFREENRPIRLTMAICDLRMDWPTFHGQSVLLLRTKARFKRIQRGGGPTPYLVASARSRGSRGSASAWCRHATESNNPRTARAATS